MVLDHGNPTVVGLRFERRALVSHVRKGELLEVFFVRIDGRTGEGRVHRAFAFGLAAVAGDLIVNRRHHRCRTHILNVRLHRDAVVAARERKGLRDLHATLFGFKHNVERVLVAEVRVLAHELERVLMIRVGAAHESSLSEVRAVGRRFEEHDVAEIFGGLTAENEASKPHFRPVGLTGNLRHFGAHDARTDEVKRHLQTIGLHHDGVGHLFSLRFRHDRRSVRSSNGHARSRIRRLRRGFFRVEEGMTALVDLIVVPKEEKRSKEDHPQEGALKFFSHRRGSALLGL